MATTLNQLQREFDDIKSLAKSDLAEQKQYLLNIRTRASHLDSGCKLLGLRLRELMDAGNPGTTIDDFHGDREVVTLEHELIGHRESCKADTNAALHKQTIAANELDHRLAVLSASLESEMRTRGDKFSSKMLRINQSVKQMGPLLAEVKRYEQNGADLLAIRVVPQIDPAASYDQKYNALMTQTISRARAGALTAQQTLLARRLVDGQSLAAAFKNAKVIYDGIVRQTDLADKAKVARKAQGLSEARAAAKKAVADVKLLADPYDKAMQDAKIVEYVSRQPRSGDIKRRVTSLLDVQRNINAKAKYITDLRL